MFRFLELSALSFTLQGKEKRGAEDWVNNWSCLRDEVSVKIPKLWGAESFQVSEHVHSLEGGVPHFHGDRSPCAWDLRDFALCTSSSDCSSASLMILWNEHFPEFWEPFQQIIAPERRGSWESQFIASQKHRWQLGTWDRQLKRGQSCAAESLTWGVCTKYGLFVSEVQDTQLQSAELENWLVWGILTYQKVVSRGTRGFYLLLQTDVTTTSNSESNPAFRALLRDSSDFLGSKLTKLLTGRNQRLSVLYLQPHASTPIPSRTLALLLRTYGIYKARDHKKWSTGKGWGMGNEQDFCNLLPDDYLSLLWLF